MTPQTNNDGTAFSYDIVAIALFATHGYYVTAPNYSYFAPLISTGFSMQ